MRNKAKIILANDLPGTQPTLYKIIGLFATVYRHGNHHEQHHAKEESNQEFFQYIPVELTHSGSEDTRRPENEVYILCPADDFIFF